MNHEVVFESDEVRNNTVGNIRIVPGAPIGMLAWLVKNKVVKNAKQAESFLMWVAIIAGILAIFFFVVSIKSNAPRPPVPSITGAPSSSTNH